MHSYYLLINSAIPKAQEHDIDTTYYEDRLPELRKLALQGELELLAKFKDSRAENMPLAYNFAKYIEEAKGL